MKKEIILAAQAGTVAGVTGYVIGKNQKRNRTLRSENNNESEKRALIVTSVASMIDQFTIPSIKLLIDMGYNVDVATNFVKGSTCPDEKVKELIHTLDELSVDCYHIDFNRKVTDLRADFKAFKQFDNVVRGMAEPISTRHHHKAIGNGYTFIHSHSPIGGVVGRIIGKRHGIKNIYTAHGFHFYDGAPKKNWFIYYPIEKALSRITDVLITINKEDYKRASEHFNAKETIYIPGVGLDVEKFKNVSVDREKKRAELGLRNDDLMLLSVGELNENKNHKVVIEAIGMMDENERGLLHYFIVGKDAGQRDALIRLAEKESVNLQLLGFRTDIPELLKTADVFILPSIREGLNVGLMEAIASGLPVIASDIRGNRDLISSENEGCLFIPSDSRMLCTAIKRIQLDNSNSYHHYNDGIQNFSEIMVCKKMRNIYACQ